MIFLKTDEEIEAIRSSSLLVGRTLGELAKHVKPGITTLELDKIGEDFIRSHNAEPAFLGYNGFPYSLCISVNDQVVHGFPSSYELKDGDIVSIDCGVLKNGFYGDSAYTFPVGDVQESVKKLLQVTKESLYVGIDQARAGNRVGHIGEAIQNYCQRQGFSVVREFVGHGIGRKLHEAPEVPNYGRRGTGVPLQSGMCIAIEPMINLGSKNVVMEKDGWTVRTKDRKPSAHYEHTIAIVKGLPEILSTFQFIEEVLEKNA